MQPQRAACTCLRFLHAALPDPGRSTAYQAAAPPDDILRPLIRRQSPSQHRLTCQSPATLMAISTQAKARSSPILH